VLETKKCCIFRSGTLHLSGFFFKKAKKKQSVLRTKRKLHTAGWASKVALGI